MKEVLIIIEQLKVQMLNEFKKISFDIVLTVDPWDEDVSPSATIIEYYELEDYNQPILIYNIVNK